MAGLGRKVWSAGDVLAAADVNGYLMDQTIMLFDDAAARTAAIGTPTQGMASYLKDTDALELFDGAAWVGGGDITAVNAGVGLVGGGTSGDVTLNVQTTLTSSTATAYTVASADQGTYLQFTNAATITFSTATAFTAGQQVQILCDGTATTIAAGTGVVMAGAGTLGTANSFTVGNQYEAVAVIAVGTNAYRVIGNVEAV